MTLWVVSGACRGVGKTRVCTELAAVLPRAMCVKIGHNPPKPGKPGNYFTDIQDFRAFQAGHTEVVHWVVESNRAELRSEADIRVFLGAPVGVEDVRPDEDEISAGADVCILATPAVDSAMATGDETCGWHEAIARHVHRAESADAVYGVFEQQRRYLIGDSPARAAGLRQVQPRFDTRGGKHR